jgi:hypothetical protein
MVNWIYIRNKKVRGPGPSHIKIPGLHIVWVVWKERIQLVYLKIFGKELGW